MIFTGASNGFWRMAARLRASSSVKLPPEMEPLPPGIGVRMTRGGIKFAVEDDGELLAHIFRRHLLEGDRAIGIESEKRFPDC